MQKIDIPIIVLLMFGLILFATAQGTVQKVTATEFPTFGCMIGVPNGWQRSPAIKGADIGRWLYKNTTTDNVPIQFVVLMKPSENESLSKHAEALANEADGKLAPMSLMLDGKPALRLTLGKSAVGYPQHEIVVSQNGGQDYLLDFYAVADEDINASIDTVVRNWKWVPFAAPADHMEFRKDSLSLLNDSVAVKIPDIMRPLPPDAEGMEKLAAFDCRTGISGFVFNVDVLPIPSEMSLLELRNNFGSLMRDKFKLKKNISWTAKAGVPAGYLSELFAVPDGILPDSVRRAKAKYSVYNRYGLVKLAHNKVALLTFTMTGQTDEDRRKYDVALRRILDSVSDGPLKK